MTRARHPLELHTSVFGRVAIWSALLFGTTLFLGFFIALPLPLMLVLALLVALCALGLTIEEIVLTRGQSRSVSGWRAVRRFFKHLFLLLP